MKKLFIVSIALIICISAYSQPSKKELRKNKEKYYALDYLSEEAILEKFGKISDAIWSYAELGMQEFKS